MKPPITPDTIEIRRRRSAFAGVRANFLTGLVVIAPIGLTVWLIWTVTGWIDGWVLPLVPQRLRPEQYVGINLRGVGVVIFLIFTVVIGYLAKGLIGRSFIRFGESLVNRMPVVRTVYSSVKQIAETVFAQSETSFDTAVLVEYPRRGLWAVAFVSTPAKGEILASRPGEDLVSVFLPTTPNPTSGFLLFVPRADLVVLDMTVEDAAKLVISAGLVYPGEMDPETAAIAQSRAAE